MALSKCFVHPTLVLFKFASLLGIFPIEVDLKTHKISAAKSYLSKTLHSIFTFMMIVRDMHYLYATVENVVNFRASNFAMVILSGIWCCYTLTAALWNYEIFQRSLNTYIILFNYIDYEIPDYRTSVSRQKNFAWHSSATTTVRGRRLRRKFSALVGAVRSLNLQETAVTISFGIVVGFLPLHWALMYLCPDWNIFLFSFLPNDWKGGWVIVTVWAYEVLTAIVTVFSIHSVCFFALGLQAFFFRLMNGKLREMRSLSSSSRRHYDLQLQSIHQWFRAYYVMIKLCNVFFRRILFSGKLLALALLIFCTFYVITHAAKGSPMLVGFSMFCNVNAMIFWFTTTKELFRIPGCMEQVKYLFFLVLHKKEGKLSSEEEAMKLDMAAIENVGISDGGFRKMEGVTQLIFAEFYLNQVIALLLAFPLHTLK